MGLVFALRVMSDICFYCTFAGFVLSLAGGGSLVVCAPVFLAALLLCGMLLGKGNLKYAPLALLIAVFFIVPFDFKNYVVLLPPCVYTVYCAAHPEVFMRSASYGGAFRIFVRLFIPFVIISAVVARPILEAGALQYGAAFLICSVLVMRMARHDEQVLAQTRFKVLNTVSVIAALLLCLAVSSPVFLSAARVALTAVYRFALAPILIALITVVINLLWPLISKIDIGRLADRLGEFDPEKVFLPEEIVSETGMSSGVFEQIVRVIGILLIAALVLFVVWRIYLRLRAMRPGASGSAGVRQRRSALGTSGRARRRASHTGNPIREAYRRLLLACENAGVELTAHMTSADVEELSSGVSGKSGEASEIRGAYIAVRYGGAEASKGEVKRFRELCKDFFK